MTDRDLLIVGVLDTSGKTGYPELEPKLRDFTISCCRFDFSGPIVEAQSVDEILARACHRGHRYCLVQAYGHAMIRYRDGRRGIDTNFIERLTAWTADRELLVTGRRLLDGGERWFGLDDLCFVVDLDVYRRLGLPRFTPGNGEPRRLPTAVTELAETTGGELRAVRPGGATATVTPGLSGWGLVAASLEHGLPVRAFDDLLRRCGYDLRPRSEAEARVYPTFRGEGILRYDGSANGIGGDWKGFLDFVQHQAKHAKHGVFLGNFEGYDDVEVPPPGFGGPVSTVYGVAAGFKVNRILATHGFDPETRVVFFDYSPVALGIRQALVEEWDGTDYPAFVEGISDRFPKAFYQLWGKIWGREPGALDLDLVTTIWERELRLWGGAAEFRDHWLRQRELEHRYVHCDLFASPGPLLGHLGSDSREVLWWSNAFHSLHGVWTYPREERRRTYRRFVDAVAAINPDLLLYGSDVNNLDLGGVRARDHRGEPAPA